MPSSRRIKTTILLIVLVTLTYIYYKDSRALSDRQFYDRTVAALEAKQRKLLNVDNGVSPKAKWETRTEEQIKKDEEDKRERERKEEEEMKKKLEERERKAKEDEEREKEALKKKSEDEQIRLAAPVEPAAADEVTIVAGNVRPKMTPFSEAYGSATQVQAEVDATIVAGNVKPRMTTLSSISYTIAPPSETDASIVRINAAAYEPQIITLAAGNKKVTAELPTGTAATLLEHKHLIHGSAPSAVAESERTPSETELEAELDGILASAPITIFSKSYCPYSKLAKSIFALYAISPAPTIVELDLHPHGAELQSKLATRTGRKTVPNVIVAGKSIGGGDDVKALNDDGKLLGIIKGAGVDVSLKEKEKEGGGDLKRR